MAERNNKCYKSANELNQKYKELNFPKAETSQLNQCQRLKNILIKNICSMDLLKFSTLSKRL